MKRYQFLLRNLVMAQRVLRNSDGDGGGGGGQDPAAAFQRLLDQHKNDGVAVASKLFDENFRYRGEIRDLKKKLPGDGSTVLTGDDAKEWTAFQALNVKVADAKKAIDSNADLEKQIKDLSGMDNLREIAELGLEGVKLKPSVLKDLMQKHPDAVLTFKTEKDKDGNEAKVAYVQKTDKDAVTSFADFAKAEFSDYLPSLKVSDEATQQIVPGNAPGPKAQGGASSVFDRIREEVKAKDEAAKPAPGMDLDSRFGRSATA